MRDFAGLNMAVCRLMYRK